MKTAIVPLVAAAAAVAFPLSLLAAPTPPPGFEAAFNGRNLDGWFGHAGEDPRPLLKASPEELAKIHADSMADVNAHWRVEGEELVNDGHGLYLTTKKNYRDFELHLEYKTVPKADSGIYLRGCPQVQIWDTTEKEKFSLGADKGSGGLWNNSPGKPGKDPLKKMDRPFGEWNKFEITMIGERVTIRLNGETVVDNAVLENYIDRKAPIFPAGPIKLQTHGGEIRWRNIFIRDISPEEAAKTLAAREKSDGFTRLDNGKDLSNWQGAVDNYEIVDGAIQCKPGKGGNLLTKEEYGDFIVQLEFKVPPAGNNGLAIRAPLEGDTAYVGMTELQVLDDNYEKLKGALDPRQRHGSAYGMLAAHPGFQHPAGEWNFQQVEVKGSRIKVDLNGFTILDGDLAAIDPATFLDGKSHPGLARTSGFFGFAGHSDPVAFRNVRIKRL
jgi:hypothetical protein